MRVFKTIKKKPWAIGLLIIVLVLAVGLLTPGWLDRLSAMESVAQEPIPIETDADASQARAAQQPVQDDSRAPRIDLANLETYQEVPVGFTKEGYPFRGDPNAPITLIEFSDYLCPFCNRHFNQTAPILLEKYGLTGQVLFVFRDFPIAALHPTAPVGHAGALCVGEQGAPLFWAMHDELFRAQSEWNSLRDPTEFVAGLARDVGADMDRYAACMASGEKEAVVDAGVAEAKALGFNGTPSFQVVDNSSGDSRTVIGALPIVQFIQLIDSRLDGQAPLSTESASLRAEETEPAKVADSSTRQEGSDQPLPDSRPSLPSDLDVEGLESYQGVPTGFTEEGYPFRGDPNAPITFVEYSDYLCPFCGRYFNQTLPTLLEEYALTGQALFVFRDLPLVSLHPTAPVGHAGALCVGEQSAPLYWAMHDELFRTQSQWLSLPDPADFVAELAEGVGADMDAYAECMATGQKQAAVDASVVEARALGFDGTPSFQFVVNDTGDIYELAGAYPVAEFAKWLDALLLDGEPPEGANAEEEPGELPFWANAEGLAPDPDRPGFTLAGDPYKGNPEAPLVVVEFSDFQCPACQAHALETQPALDSEFIDSGEILWVFKPLPLKEHAQAVVAAVAAECAAEQGQFWEMHHLLFQRMEQWATDDVDAELLELAQELDIDFDLFATCLNSRQALQRVLDDLYDAQGTAKTTPTFIFLYGGKGYVTQGSRPADEFAKIIEGRLEDASLAD